MWCSCVRVKQCVVRLCEGSNSVWCGCVRGQTVCGICACANCKHADLAILHKCY